MATAKKTVKKATTQETKRLAFNKKNVLDLADKIFSTKNGVMNILCLCEGHLAKKSGAKTMHCAVGEAYHTFVGSTMPKKAGTASETERAIDQLTEVAQLKKGASQASLQEALNNAVDENDNGEGNTSTSAAEYADRAERVADVFRKQVAPLLK